MLRGGKFPVIRRGLGSKMKKMVFAEPARTGLSVKTVEVPEADRNRFCLSDEDVIELARFALRIEEHYQRPMDIEWAKDGADGKIYILQARPETVKSRRSAEGQERFLLKQKSEVLASGRAIGHKIGAGILRVLKDPSEMGRIKPGDLIVTAIPDPNWEPVMKRARAIVTHRGGRTPPAPPLSAQAALPRGSGPGYRDPRSFFVEKMSEGIAPIAAAFWAKPVIVRLSDFKSNEYKKLIGGARYEPDEENPMLGFRGASRYIAESFRRCFEMECQAMRRVRNEIGLTNVEIMVPFVRTLGECAQVIELLAANGLKRGENGLRLIMMCEVPSNAVLAEQFLEHFDGFSIGSNDLTQLTLGLDRDSGLVADAFDERDPP